MMRNVVSSYIEKFKNAKQARRRVVSVIVALALVVSCGVYWELREDGVAMANETFCGMEEHLHGDECYEQVLTCGLEETEGTAGHTHDASCYDAEGALICGREEAAAVQGHVHTDSCYETVLTCEIPEHTHSVDCLIDETADVETASDWEDTLPDDLTGVWAEDVVAIAASQIGYTESESNFRLAEDDETRQGYTRYGAWYGNEYGDWDAMFASFCLYYAGVPESEFPEAGGVYAWITQLQKIESGDDTGETVLLADAEGYIPEPGALVFFDMNDEDNIVYEDGTVEPVPDHVGIVESVQVKTVDGESSEDIPGADADEGDPEVGLEAEEERVLEKIWVIEGDREDEVQRVVYDFTSDNQEDVNSVAAIEAYGVLPENPDMAIEEKESDEIVGEDNIIEPDGSASDITYTAEDGGVMVEVSVPEGSLPEGAELVVTLLGEDSEEYAEVEALVGIENDVSTVSAESEADNESDGFVLTVTTPEQQMTLLDISFMNNGREVEPTQPADVVVDFSGLIAADADTDTIRVMHMEETENGMCPVLVAETADGTVDPASGIAEFSVDSFSGFALSWENDSYKWSVHIHCVCVDDYGNNENNHTQLDGVTCSYEIEPESDGGTRIDIDDLLASIDGVPDGYYYSFATIANRNYDSEFGSHSNSASYVVTTPNSGTAGRMDFVAYDANGNSLGSSYVNNDTTSGTDGPHYNINLYYEKTLQRFENDGYTEYKWHYDDGDNDYSWTLEIDYYYADQFGVSGENNRTKLSGITCNLSEDKIELDENGNISFNIDDILNSLEMDEYYCCYFASMSNRTNDYEYGTFDNPAAMVRAVRSGSGQNCSAYNSAGEIITVNSGTSNMQSFTTSNEGRFHINLYFKSVDKVKYNDCTSYTWYYADGGQVYSWTMEVDCFLTEDYGRETTASKLDDITFDYDLVNENGSVSVVFSDMTSSMETGSNYTFRFAVVSNSDYNRMMGADENSANSLISSLNADNHRQIISTFDKDGNIISDGQGDSFWTGDGGVFHVNLYYSLDSYDGVIFSPSNKTAGKNGSNGAGRTAISGLSQYADEDGVLEIILPTDEQLGEDRFTVYRGVDAGGNDVIYEADAPDDFSDEYEWKLVGWYNIADGEYYAVEDGTETTAKVNLYNKNIFYADYIPASYDFGTRDDEDFVETISTADFVTINMFDYNELFNLYSADLETSFSYGGEFTESSFDETWSDGGSFYDTPTCIDRERNEDEALSNSFILLGSANGRGTLLYPSGAKSWNNSTTTIHSASNWEITSPKLNENPILWSLFSPDSDRLGVTYVGTADYLFQYGGEGATGADGQDYEGYYYYSSKMNSAAYNQSDKRFYVYDRYEKYEGLTMFLPFNYFTDGDDHGDRYIDYWFGMSMEIDFYLPDDTGTPDDPSENKYQDKDMQFNFSGDDDIMIFIDDDLVLDMAGIHTEAVGNINYAEGTWNYYVYTYGNTGISQEKNGTFSLGAGDHKMTVYYMERGRSASNLTVSFNIIPVWRYQSDYVTTVTAEKEWSDGSENHESDTVRMGVFELVENGEYILDGDNLIIGDKTYIYKDSEDYRIENESYKYVPFYYETDGDGIAWYDEDSGELYVLSTQLGGPLYIDLSEANDWSYTWESLDADKTYIVLEMTSVDHYISGSSQSEDENADYSYWSIIGETELEDNVSDKSDDDIRGTAMYVLLTDAAQSGQSAEDTKGIVIGHELKIYDDIVFSIRPKVETIESDVGNVSGSDIITTYGVIGNKQIKADMVWTRTYTTDADYDVWGSMQVHTFTLSYVNDETTYYLACDDNLTEISLTTEPEKAAEFYCDMAGEIRLHSDTSLRVVVDSDGSLSLADISDTLQYNNLRIYTLTTGHTSLLKYSILNTLLTSFRVEKQDSNNQEITLSGAEFTLTKQVTVTDDENETSENIETWYYNGTGWTRENVTFKTDESGIISFTDIEPGTYTLTEVSPPDGYMLPDEGPIEFTISGSGELVLTSSELKYVVVEVDEGSGIIKLMVQDIPGSVLPNTGGLGTKRFYVIGLLIACGAAGLLYRNKRRGVIR